jgi:hypothetical protein
MGKRATSSLKVIFKKHLSIGTSTFSENKKLSPKPWLRKRKRKTKDPFPFDFYRVFLSVWPISIITL